MGDKVAAVLLGGAGFHGSAHLTAGRHELVDAAPVHRVHTLGAKAGELMGDFTEAARKLKPQA